MMSDEYTIRSSNRRDEWEAAKYGLDDGLLKRLLEQEPPGVIAYETYSYIVSLIEKTQSRQMEWSDFRTRVLRELKTAEQLRRELGWQHGKLDIGLLQYLRRSGRLSAVIGAGVTMDAGGPSWPLLVRGLVKIALEKEYSIGEILYSIPGIREKEIRRRRLVPVPPISDAAREKLIKLCWTGNKYRDFH